MEPLSEILFICIAIPMIPMLFILPEKRSRLFLGYMIIGCLICLLSAALDHYFLELFNNDMRYVTTTITPVTEEILKALPVLYFAIIFNDDRDTLLSISFATGVGFAILENAVIFAKIIQNVSIEWAIIRVVGTALMHAACTCLVGMGISYVHKRKKLFFSGTFALLMSAIIFHASFNVLIESDYSAAALIMPTAIYIPVVVTEITRRRKAKKANAEKKQ